MGANATATAKAVGTGSATGSGWWFRKAGAVAATYSFSWSLTADGTTTPGTTPAKAKFLPGPVGIGWGANTPSLTGALGSTASATQSGSSTVNFGAVFDTYSSTSLVTASTAAVVNSSAAATSTVVDPWTVRISHTPGRATYLLVTVVPDFVLYPSADAGLASSSSGLTLAGSFGKIELSLDGVRNRPQCDVTLATGWSVYRNVRFPRSGFRFPAPKNPLSAAGLRKLFLQQHSSSATVWHWKSQAPALTFVKAVPPSVTSEDVSVDIGVTDAEARVEDGGGRRRSRGSQQPRG